MLVQVKLFGPMGQAVGKNTLSLSLEGASQTCSDLRARIAADEPRLAALLNNCRIAINGKFVSEERPLLEQDEVALIGFVSGG